MTVTLPKVNTGQIMKISLNASEPCKFCGAHATLWVEYIRGGIELYWYECDCCHKFLDTTGTARGALRIWNDSQNGKIGKKRRMFGPKF